MARTGGAPRVRVARRASPGSVPGFVGCRRAPNGWLLLGYARYVLNLLGDGLGARARLAGYGQGLGTVGAWRGGTVGAYAEKG